MQSLLLEHGVPADPGAIIIDRMAQDVEVLAGGVSLAGRRDLGQVQQCSADCEGDDRGARERGWPPRTTCAGDPTFASLVKAGSGRATTGSSAIQCSRSSASARADG